LSLVALEDADGAGEGRELDLGQAAANRAEQSLGIARRGVANAVRIGLEERFGPIVDIAGGGLRISNRKSRCPAKRNFHQTAGRCACCRMPVRMKVTVEQNVAGGWW
jgi:hypothetical protein